MSKSENASRGTGAAQHGSRAGRPAAPSAADPRAELEFSEILFHRERVKDGSGAGAGAAGDERMDVAAGREPPAAPVPSMFFRSDMRVSDRTAETAEPAASADARREPADRTGGTPRADAREDRPAPQLAEAVVRTLARGWETPPSTGEAGNWIMRIALSETESAELEIELAPDGAWHVSVRGDEERGRPDARQEIDARAAGIARDAGEFRVELERWLTDSRPELRIFAREA